MNISIKVSVSLLLGPISKILCYEHEFYDENIKCKWQIIKCSCSEITCQLYLGTMDLEKYFLLKVSQNWIPTQHMSVKPIL